MVFDASVAGFTKDDVLALAGGKVLRPWHRVHPGRHESRDERGRRLCESSGKDFYEVELDVDLTGLSGTCDCPWGEDSNFCKHCVAVALVYESGRDNGGTLPQRFDPRSHLELLDHEELVDLLMEAADATASSGCGCVSE
jgi:uncharacterized Zn finger protein